MARSICKEDGCDKFVVAHGLCDKHRQRLVKHGHTAPTRPNDWGRREKHPLYDLWKTKLRWNLSQRMCGKWKESFWDFVADVTDRPSKDHFLRAIDTDLPIGPDNWHWVEKIPSSSGSDDKKNYLKAWAREDRKLNPRKYKCKALQKSYGITLEKYEELKKSQGDVCAICAKPEAALNPHTKEPRELAVDHCHNSGVIRGLLCGACNSALGKFKDDIKLLEKAIKYLGK